MIAERTNTYRAVVCRRCNRPIPVSAKVASLQDEFEFNETDVPGAFVARCKVCEHESVYAITSVQSFEGQPQKRTSRARAAGA